jgi:pimeloyl-ACP methyl ester carboxylesterase
MAEDVIALLGYIGWTARRDLHVVGASLGGMIALGEKRPNPSRPFVLTRESTELASRIPERIASLALVVTTAGGWPWSNLPPV